MKKSVKVLLAKNRRYWKSILNRIDNVSRSETQTIAIAIIKKAINHPESKLLYAPLSNIKFIHYKDIFVKIDGNDISVINGVYSYHITIPTQDTEYLSNKFRQKLESIRNDWDSEITHKVTRSLSSVLDDLSKIK